ncbi:MAG TPA: hypothetical protein VFS54_07490 [Solirubrobacterales bacterium]|nr:hypothetical protein [Solirubrobacterales bacterium]
MEEESNGLGPWILLPLVLLIVVLLAAWISLPVDVCNAPPGEDDDGGGPVMWVVIALCSVAVGGAGLARLIAMWRSRSLGEGSARATVVLVAVAVVLMGALSVDSATLSGVLLAGLVLAGLTFTGLLVAALAGKEVEDVGLLLPVSLIALGFFGYPFFGYAAANANLGGLC